MLNTGDVKFTEAINGIQRALVCCGRTGPADWSPRAIPSSCCADGTTGTCTIANAFPTGCSQVLFDGVNSSGMLIAWIAAVFAAFEVRICIF